MSWPTSALSKPIFKTSIRKRWQQFQQSVHLLSFILRFLAPLISKSVDLTSMVLCCDFIKRKNFAKLVNVKVWRGPWTDLSVSAAIRSGSFGRTENAKHEESDRGDKSGAGSVLGPVFLQPGAETGFCPLLRWLVQKPWCLCGLHLWKTADVHPEVLPLPKRCNCPFRPVSISCPSCTNSVCKCCWEVRGLLISISL